MTSYDPEAYWNARAREHASDPVRAACLDDADDNRCIDRVQRHLLRAALRRSQQRTTLQGKTVLDYGCGSGRWISFLRAYGLAYSGADIAEEMLAIAHRLHPDADLRRIDSNRLSYPDGSFDVVSAVAVLHHNPYEAQDSIIAEMARVLRPDGALLLFEGLGPAVSVISMARSRWSLLSAKSDRLLGRRGVTGTNYFPRPLHDWMELVARHGLSCTWHRGATYMLLRPLARRAGAWRRAVTRIDAVVNPYVVPLLPQRYHTRAVMLFARTLR